VVRKLCSLAVVVVMFGCAAGAWAAGPAVSKGFGDAAWGSDVSKRPGFMKLKSMDGVDYYVNLRERVEVKNFEQPTIFYAALGGKLYAVHLRLKGAGAYDALHQDLAQTFGPGRQQGEGNTTVTRWRAGPLKMKLKAASQGEVKLSFYYQPIAAKQSVSLREIEPGPSEDLLKMMPPGENQLKEVGSQPGTRKEQAGGIDLVKLLRVEGATISRPIR
jgi:hypothetical protein